MRRIVKLRIKPEVPSLELNDPAVNANILKKVSVQNPPCNSFILMKLIPYVWVFSEWIAALTKASIQQTM